RSRRARGIRDPALRERARARVRALAPRRAGLPPPFEVTAREAGGLAAIAGWRIGVTNQRNVASRDERGPCLLGVFGGGSPRADQREDEEQYRQAEWLTHLTGRRAPDRRRRGGEPSRQSDRSRHCR